MKKQQFFIVILALFFCACSAPVRYYSHDYSNQPLPKKSAEILITKAKNHVGEPYRYGGDGKHGWDCSGFVREIYDAALDIKLPRNASAMYTESIRMSPSKYRPGDLVFFRINSQKPSHVGIYLGHRRFIHVSTSDGVIISSLDEHYYQRHFIGIRRPRLQSLAQTDEK